MTLARNSNESRRPRIGCAGAGWIGEHRLRAVADSGAGEVVAIADPDRECRERAAAAVAAKEQGAEFTDLLDLDLDGVMIATPSALHAEQAVAALERGLAVFCQKPLARTAREACRVVAAAEASNCLLDVDFSYRHAEAIRRVAELCAAGELGDLYALDLVFHNAYGPDKAWFYDVDRAGGGCVMDLGIHLVDLALWLSGFPAVQSVASHLYAGGKPLAPGERCTEDYASIQMGFAGGPVARLTCSWNLSAGVDAVIEVSLYGTKGAGRMRNVGGSFFDFVAERCRGTEAEPLCEPPDAWGGRAAVAWARKLAADNRFQPEAWRLVDVSEVLDRVYGRQKGLP